MSIEWNVRLNGTVSADALLTATREVLRDAIGLGVPELVLEASSRGMDHSRARVDGNMPLSSGTSIELGRVGTLDATVIDVLDVGMPDDAEGGIWLTALSHRTDMSMLISVSAAVAAARLCDTEVVDEPGLLGRRISTPTQAIDRLRQVDLTTAKTADERAGLIIGSLRKAWARQNDHETG